MSRLVDSSLFQTLEEQFELRVLKSNSHFTSDRIKNRETNHADESILTANFELGGQGGVQKKK